MEIKLNMADKTHQQFVDWIADLEQSSVGTWSSSLKRSGLIYKDGFRLMFFSDTNAFDSTGSLSVDYFKAKSVSALCALQGLWISADKYGLRLNVKQFKFFTEELDYGPSSKEEEIVVNKTPMFVDDD
jgi:hypothetical protein